MKLRNWPDKLFALAFYPPILMLMVVIYIVASVIWNNTLYAIWGLMFLMFSVLSKLDEKEEVRMTALNQEFHEMVAATIAKRSTPDIRTTHQTKSPLWRDRPQ